MSPDLLVIMAFIKDLVTAIAAGVAIYVALDGLNTWKNKLKGTTKYELAHRVLTETYRLRDVIGYMRNTKLSREKKQVLQEDDTENLIEDPDFDFKIEKIILQNRWERVSTVLSDYESMSAEVEAHLEEEVKIKLNAISGHVLSLKTPFDIYLLFKENKYDKKPEYRVTFEFFNRRLYASNDKNDTFKIDLEKKIQALEESLDEYRNLKE